MSKKVIIFDVDGVILNFGKKNLEVYEYIKNNYKKYDLFTNTSFLKIELNRMFIEQNIGQYFMELLTYDNGSKKENIEYVMQVYGVSPENILFIDDDIYNINSVENTGVNTLLFIEDGVSLEEKVNSIFGK